MPKNKDPNKYVIMYRRFLTAYFFSILMLFFYKIVMVFLVNMFFINKGLEGNLDTKNSFVNKKISVNLVIKTKISVI